MKPVPQTKLAEVLTPVFRERIDEAGLQERTTVEHVLKTLEAGYATRSISAFVDSLEAAKSCLVVGQTMHPALQGVQCVAYVFWVDRMASEGRQERMEEMFKTLESYADLNACESTMVSSWRMGSLGSLKNFWESRGYDLQEEVYVKVRKD